jgi:hypothetical protein
LHQRARMHSRGYSSAAVLVAEFTNFGFGKNHVHQSLLAAVGST